AEVAFWCLRTMLPPCARQRKPCSTTSPGGASCHNRAAPTPRPRSTLKASLLASRSCSSALRASAPASPASNAAVDRETEDGGEQERKEHVRAGSRVKNVAERTWRSHAARGSSNPGLT